MSSAHEPRSVPYSGVVMTSEGAVQYSAPIFNTESVFDSQLPATNQNNFDSQLTVDWRISNPPSSNHGAMINRGDSVDTDRDTASMAAYIQRLEQERISLDQENRSIPLLREENANLLRHLQSIEATEDSFANHADELAKAHQENASLAEMARSLQEQLMQAEKQVAGESFDPVVQDRVAELERHNQKLLNQLQNVVSTQQSEANISTELAKAHKEIAEFAAREQDLEKLLSDVMANQSSSGPSLPSAQQANRGDPQCLADLEEREKLMSEEIDKLQAEVVRLQQGSDSAGASASAEQGAAKKKKFICC